MNEVKRSLDAVAGDVSNDKKELKQRVLSGRRKPRRRNPFPAVATIIVLAAVMFLAFNVFQGEFSDNKTGAYEINETYYDISFTSETFEHVPDHPMRYSLLQQILQSDSLIEFAKSTGYKENEQTIEERVKEQQQTFYNDFTEEELQSLEQNQLDSFGYTYDEYFENVIEYTTRYTDAVNWLDNQPTGKMKMHREVLDNFMKEHKVEIASFMKKKKIVSPPGNLKEIEREVLVTSIDGDVVSAVFDLEEEQVKSMSAEELEETPGFARFMFNDTVGQIKPYTKITITYDPLSYPINQAYGSKFFQDVTGWE